MPNVFQNSMGAVTLGGSLGSGRGGGVFAVDGNDRLAAKLLRDPSPEVAERLYAMIANPPWELLRGGIVAAWPMDTLSKGDRRSGVLAGFTMPRVAGRPLNEWFSRLA